MKPFLRPRHLLAAAALALALAPTAAAVDPGVVATGVINKINEADKADDLMKGLRDDQGWVRIFVTWSTMEVDRKGSYDAHQHDVLDARIAAFRRARIKVLLVVTNAPDWSHPSTPGATQPPDNPTDYADFMAHLAERYSGTTPGLDIQGLEIWNEPDSVVFWAGAPQPERYAELVRVTYAAVKAKLAAVGARDIAVSTGGLVGNDYDFVAQLYAPRGDKSRGIKGFMDAVGVHTDTACLTDHPGTAYREPDGRIGRFSFSGYREVHQVMVENGDGGKPVWMTEIGWSTSDGRCNTGVNKDKKPAGVSQADQARFLNAAYTCMDDYVGMALWFSLQDFSKDLAYDHRLGLIDFDGGEKSAFKQFRDVTWSTPAGPGHDAKCGMRVDRDAPVVKASAPASYFDRLAITATATDPTTTVTRMEITADGKKVPGSQDGGKFDLNWLGARELSFGDHTIEVRAIDEGRNVGTAVLKVKRINRKNAAATLRARFPFKVAKKAGRRLLITGRIQAALNAGGEKPKGRVRIFIERKSGKRWKPTSRFTKGIARPFKINYKAKKAGTWRVRARFNALKPYKSARTKTFVFKL